MLDQKKNKAKILQSGRIFKSSSRRHPSSRSQNTSHIKTERSYTQSRTTSPHTCPPILVSPNSAIVKILVGPNRRLFAAHEEVLTRSSWFAELLNRQSRTCTPESLSCADPRAINIELPDQEAEIFSSVLEYLYKGDYFPRIEYDRRRHVYSLEDDENADVEAVVWQSSVGAAVLKDTLIYCAATLYALPDLKRLAFKKQTLRPGTQCSTILTSARFAYQHTPVTDSRLRAHYLALIIRSKDIFRRSGTMQTEMGKGGPMWFDLFVALVHHLDCVSN